MKKLIIMFVLIFATLFIVSCKTKELDSLLSGEEWSLEQLDTKLEELTTRDASAWNDPSLVAGDPTPADPVAKWEHEILKVQNFLRKNPKKFVDYVEAYKNTARNKDAQFKLHMGLGGEKSTEGNKSETWNTLVNDLNNLSGVTTLTEDPLIKAVAKAHSEAAIKHNKGGHATIDAGIEGGNVGDDPFTRATLPKWHTSINAENVYSGFVRGGLKSATDKDLFNVALDTVMVYLLDYNQLERGHRKNILAPHSKTGTGCYEGGDSGYTTTFCTNDFS